MRKCTLIVSPGGNGNHMWDTVLQAAGSVKYSDNDFGDPCIDDPTEYNIIHWFRSFPSQRYRLEELDDMVIKLRQWGYRVQAIIPARDWYCAGKSQMKRHGVCCENEVERNMRAGYPYIMTTFNRLEVPWMLVTFGGAVLHRGYVAWVLRKLGLPEDNIPDIRNENEKWYERLNDELLAS